VWTPGLRHVLGGVRPAKNPSRREAERLGLELRFDRDIYVRVVIFANRRAIDDLMLSGRVCSNNVKVPKPQLCAGVSGVLRWGVSKA
jgi:hypothetical protein